ncbi:sulfite exporter TauE/SafE family protein [Domibacillus enclensis]|uniref:Nickel/cobalt efflux system n=1 Tax=Domibacillus enclensis TaxID=1017273 RepID=A0ABX4E701_9BACI|nr:sulfite exporter TauE/SafE family protein [Domibacillus enclensis]OXS76770.1 urease accessory protein UreH [Domibacillus enclensis]
MQSGLLSVLLLGFTLGIKHATEPDHVIAVSTIASQTKKLSRSSLAGVFWGLGHTATLLVIGVTAIALGQHIPENVATLLEFFVGVMLVYLGINGIRKNPVIEEGKQQHFHKKSFVIGVIHGLAGSAAMVLLTAAAADTGAEAFQYILLFGAGTIVGMLLFTTLLGLPFLVASKKSIPLFLMRATSLISIVYGLYYMIQTGSSLFS